MSATIIRNAQLHITSEEFVDTDLGLFRASLNCRHGLPPFSGSRSARPDQAARRRSGTHSTTFSCSAPP